MNARLFAFGLLLASAIVWAYFPILDNGFVWDDGANLIAARPMWEGDSGLAWAFKTPWAGHYQPLTFLSYRLDAWWSDATPRGVHATQLALHLLVTLMVAALAHSAARTPALRTCAALQSPAFPFLAAALFSLSPVRVESVAWATERRDLLGALLTIAALTLFLRAAPGDLKVRLALAGLAALSALARAQMTLPVVLLLLDLWPLNRLASGQEKLQRLLLEKAPLWAIAFASATAALWAQAASGALTSGAEHGLFARLVQAGYGLAFYPSATFVPQLVGPLLPLYERPYAFDPWQARFLVPAILVLGTFALLVWGRRRWPAASTAFFGYLLLVAPVLGLAQSGIQLVADRYAYLSTVPLVLLVAGALSRLSAAQSRKGQVILGLLVATWLVAAALSTREQTLFWKDDLTLWRHVLAHAPSSLADNNLGQHLGRQGALGPALFHLTRSLENAPSYPRPWSALAALLEAKRPADGPPTTWVAATLVRALPYQPGLQSARFATALALLQDGQDTEAERELRRLLAAAPRHDGARLALARLEGRKLSAGAPRAGS